MVHLSKRLAGVDSITQAALGATVGALVLGRKVGRPAIGWGALLGTVPDLDALLTPFLDTAWDLWIHRGFTHSLLCMLLVSLLLAKPFSKRWKKQKVTPQEAGIFVFLIWSTHVLIDCFTTYGTQVFSPFSAYPVSFDNLFIMDPLFTLPLLVAVVLGLRIDLKRWKKREGVRITAICVGISCVYVGLSFWAKYSVSQAIVRDLSERGVKWERKMEAPAPFSILLWRGVVEREDEFWVGYRSILDGSAKIQWTIYPKNEAVLQKWENSFEVDAVKRFSKGWLIARETQKGVWLVDLRFGEYREWDKRGLALRPLFAWEYMPEGRGDPMKSRLKKERDFQTMLHRMWARIWGDQERWGGKTRLIGNPARPQEYLPTIW